MRFVPDLTSDFLAALSRTDRDQATALRQLSSGRRMETASDDPASYALALQTHGRMAANDQFSLSTSTVNSMLQTADATLNSVVTALTRAITLGVEGSNGTISSSQRQAIAAEVDGIGANVLTLANSTFHGTFLFGGTRNTAAPFVADPNAASGVFYAGSSEVNSVEIGTAQSVDVGLPGDEIFASPSGDALGSLHRLAAALTGNDTRAITDATAEVRAAFDHVTTKRVFYGNTMQQLHEAGQFLDSNRVELRSEWDRLAAADPIAAASDLSAAKDRHDETVAAAAQVSRLSLLDYLS